jgi:transcriptional regulator with PAS, ATPase and Fis domain
MTAALRLQFASESNEDIERTELLEFGKKHSLIGTSEKFLHFLKELNTLSTLSHIVLLEGETGTGKELAARALHNDKEGLFIPVNCGSLTGEMGRVELEGYRRNSFSGGERQDRAGLFAQAANGTILLDEVQLLESTMQQRILRILQNKTILPIGESKELPLTNVRIVAASNANLESMVAEGTFREDLYYRLHVLGILIPPLRERSEDIHLLGRHFIQKYREELNSSIIDITEDALSAMQKYRWPGNVREMENTIIGILAHKGKKGEQFIEFTDLPENVSKSAIELTLPINVETGVFTYNFDPLPKLDKAYKVLERFIITRALQQTNGCILQTAELLGITRGKVSHRITEFGIQVVKQ